MIRRGVTKPRKVFHPHLQPHKGLGPCGEREECWPPKQQQTVPPNERIDPEPHLPKHTAVTNAVRDWSGECSQKFVADKKNRILRYAVQYLLTEFIWKFKASIMTTLRCIALSQEARDCLRMSDSNWKTGNYSFSNVQTLQARPTLSRTSVLHSFISTDFQWTVFHEHLPW